MSPVPSQFLLKKTYLAVIKSSVGSPMFRASFVRTGTRTREVLKDGNLACAFYATAILAMFGLVRTMHATVSGTERDLIASGWTRIAKPKPGCVLIYAPQKNGHDEPHRHIGFFVGNGKVVDNSSEKRAPILRAWDYRPVESLWWHSKLDA